MVKHKDNEERLYDNQLLLLQILYKFRFGTNDLIAQYRGLTRRSINKSLSILVDNEYVVRKFDKQAKFRSEPAVYFLKPKAISYLKRYFPLDERMIQATYKNYMVSDQFIDDVLAAFKAYLVLNEQYHEEYDIFTKAEIAKFEQFPEQLPHLYLTAKDDSKDYMLNIYRHEPFFVIKKRIKQLIEHRNEEWDDTQPYPSVLLACPDPRTEDKVIKYTESQLEDFDFLITTVKALDHGGQDIWTNPVEPEKLVRL